MPNSSKTPLRPLTASDSPIRKLGVMAKVATEGKVKTRLGNTIGFDKSAQIHQRFLDHLFKVFQHWGDERHWVASPIKSISPTATKPTSHWQIIDQGGGNLGDRMRRWFANHAFNHPALPRTHAILIGADCPLLSPAEMDEADRLFRDCDLVLGPASDGGYYLIGLSMPADLLHEKNAANEATSAAGKIFNVLWKDIRWSTGEVFDRTVAAAEAIGLRLGTLPMRPDVDTEDDLTALLHQIEHPVDNAEVSSDHIELARDIRRILSQPMI